MQKISKISYIFSQKYRKYIYLTYITDIADHANVGGYCNAYSIQTDNSLLKPRPPTRL